MNTQLRTEIETYLSTEKELNSSVQKWSDFNDTMSAEELDALDSRIELLTKKLTDQAEIAAEGFGIEVDKFIDLVNEFEENKRK